MSYGINQENLYKQENNDSYVVYFWSGTIQKYFKKKIQNFSFSTKLIKAHLKTIKFLSMKGQRYTEDGPKLSAPVASRTQGASRSSRKKRKEN